MPAIKNALIIGGGIGGLTCARALRLQGIDVDLIEKAPDWTVYGVGIIQPNNALRALGIIGIADQCIAAGGAFRGWTIFDHDGNLIADPTIEGHAAPEYPRNNGITRPKLHEILIAGAKGVGTDIRLKTTVVEMHDDGEGVDVTTSDGQVGRYDLVIGYEGANSPTRSLLFGEDKVPEFVGQGVWRYNMPRPAEVDNGRVYFGPDTKVGLVPLSDTMMYMFVVTAEPDNNRYEGPHLAEEMRSRIKGYTGLVADLAKTIVNSDEVVYRPIGNVMIEEDWYKGRVMIAGDAAHCTTPHLAQGASLAIEDSVLLGELLGTHDSLATALPAFMERRLERSQYVVKCSTQIAVWELEAWKGIENPESRPGQLLHEAVSRMMKEAF